MSIVSTITGAANPSGVVFKTIIAIIATGALLKVLGDGKLGVQGQKFAQYITKGYGV